MPEHGLAVPQVSAGTETVETGFACGYFSPTGNDPPRTCLKLCLAGDPKLAAVRGCRMVRELAQSQGAPGADLEVPETCARGYAVKLTPPQNLGEPHVLALCPPTLTRHPEILAAATQAMTREAREKWQLHRENDGLAEEVLRCYEQVNLIFDISGEVAALTEPEDVRRVLLHKLRYIYRADSVFYVNPHDNLAIQVNGSGWTTSRADTILGESAPQVAGPGETTRVVLPAEGRVVIEKVLASPQVLAASNGNHELEAHGHGTSIWGPLRYRESEAAVVGVVRRGKPFEAGDMLLLDSTLTFGSHILSNMHLVTQLRRASFEAVRALVNAIDQKDPYTCGHSERVGFLAWAVGRHLGLSTQQLQELEWGGLLHDIGKIGIPEDILNKPGKLTPEEFGVIQKHPARGHTVLQPVASLGGVLDIVLYHHEAADGTGYPRGLKGDEIPYLARIVHVTDVFDALTSTRSYRQAFDAERALGILHKESGTKLDPDIVAAFVETWNRLPAEYPEQYHRWFTIQEDTP